MAAGLFSGINLLQSIRMTEYCKNNRTPEPEFKEEFSGPSVIFPFKESMNSTSIAPKEPLTPLQDEILLMLHDKSYEFSSNQ